LVFAFRDVGATWRHSLYRFPAILMNSVDEK
jgi:hypothetical protein